eukprot:gene2309-2454_t
MQFDEFKKNLQLVEKKLQTSSGKDLPNDVTIAISWVQYVMKCDPTSNEWIHYVKEYLPNSIKVILNRKSDLSLNDCKELLKYLEQVIIFCIEFLGRDASVSTTLGLIFDNTEPFYQKIYNLEAVVSAANTTTNSFVEGLEVGTCIDYKPDANSPWEIAIIEQVTEFKTEFKISLASGTNIWIMVDRDKDKYAPFGTKTGLDSSTATANDSSSNQVAQPDASNIITTVPEKGSLIDVQDRYGTWYQACVLDYEEVVCSEPIKPPPPPQPELIDFTKDVESGVEESKADENTVILLPEMTVSPQTSNNTDEVQIITKYRLRIAFLGFAESVDEWIFLDSDRKIAKFNTMSQGRHGDNRIRPEVRFLSHQNAKKLSLSALSNGARFTLLRDDAFTSQEFVKLVEQFGCFNGFTRIIDVFMSYFRQQQQQHQPTTQENSPPSSFAVIGVAPPVTVTIEMILPLIGLFGDIVKYLNHFQSSIMYDYLIQILQFSQKIVLEMNIIEIRTLSTDVIEEVMNSIEFMIYEIYGYNKQPSGEINEPFRFNIGIRYLSSPFLNRRLFGLKLINELIKRTLSLKSFGNGISRTITQEKPSTASASTTSNVPTVIAPVVINYVYQYYPITYFYTTNDLCERLLENSIFTLLYEGNEVHESIITRSASILIAFANENLLAEEMMKHLLTIGLKEQLDVLKLFPEMISHLSVKKMYSLAEIIQGMFSSETAVQSSSSLSTREVMIGDSNAPNSAVLNIIDPIIDILYHIGLQTRNILFNKECYSLYDDEILTNNDSYDSQVLHTHEFILEILYSWTNEKDSSLLFNTIHFTIEKLENLIETGLNVVAMNEKPFFPIHRQYIRCSKLLNKCLHHLQNNQCIYPSLKILHQYVYTWPTFYAKHGLWESIALAPPQEATTSKTDENAMDVEKVEGEQGASTIHWSDIIPFFPIRAAFIQYLLKQFNGFTLLTNEVMILKKEFIRVIQTFKAAEQQGDTTSTQDGYSKVKLFSSRYTYVLHIELLLDTIYLFFRSLDKLYLPYQEIELLFQVFINNSIIQDEYDLMINFINKIPTKLGDSGTGSGGSASANASSENKSFFESSKEGFINIFTNLLCSLDVPSSSSVIVELQEGQGSSLLLHSFIRSPYFNLKGYKCIEKWFRWINNELGHLTDSRDKIIFVKTEPTKLVGVDIFLQIIFESEYDHIANQSVNFLTHLIQVAAFSLDFRTKLFSDCMNHLRKLRQSLLDDQLNNGHQMTSLEGLPVQKIQSNDRIHSNSTNYIAMKDDGSIKINRILLLLNGLIDESNQTIRERIYCHTQCIEGNIVTFKISSSSQKLKNLHTEIKIRVHAKIQELINEIARVIKLAPNEFKVFRLGKELLSSEYNKSISQFHLLSEKENLVIAEKPHSATPKVASAATAKEGEADKTTVIEPPKRVYRIALVKKISLEVNYYQLFFDLLSLSSLSGNTSSMNDLWNTLVQLPTSKHYLRKWLELQEDTITSLVGIPLSFENGNEQDDGSFEKNKSRFCELLYHLQIIELFLNPLVPMTELLRQYGDHYTLLTDSTVAAALAGEGEDLSEIEDDLKLYQSWLFRFLQKGGINFLQEVFAFLARIMTNVQNNGSQFSYRIILLSSQLICKLLRFFMLQTCLLLPLSSHNEHGPSDYSWLYQYLIQYYYHYESHGLLPKSFQNEYNKLSDVNGNEHHTEIEKRLAALEWGKKWISAIFTTIEGQPKVTAAAESKEEGKTDVVANSHEDEEKKKRVDEILQYLLPLIQQEKNYENIIYFFIHFCQLDIYHRYELFHAEQLAATTSSSTAGCGSSVSSLSNANNLKTAEYFEKQTLYSLFKNLLFLWISISILQPSYLTTQRYYVSSSTAVQKKAKEEDLYHILVACGIYGDSYSSMSQNPLFLHAVDSNDAGDSSSSTNASSLNDILLKVRNKIKSPLTEWFGVGFSNYLEWIIQFSSSSSSLATTEASLLKHFTELVLHMRPSIEPTYELHHIRHNYQQFILAKWKIIHQDQTKSIFTVAVNILTVLEKFHLLSIVSTEYWRIHCMKILHELQLVVGKLKNHEIYSCYNFEGNIILLSWLVKTKDSYLESIFIDKIADFILHELLELTVTNPTATTISSSNAEDNKSIRPLITSDLCEKKFFYNVLEGMASSSSPSSSSSSTVLGKKLLNDLMNIHKSIFKPENNIIPTTMYEFSPEKENRSKYNYAGLRNLGSTCYMNSLLQILYNNTTIRNYFLYELNYDSYYLHPVTGEVMEEKKEELRNDIGFQLQKVFLHLWKTEKKFIVPNDFTFAFKDEVGQPMNVLYQQDAQEFFLTLCHRFENNIVHHQRFLQQQQDKQGQGSGPSLPKDIFQVAFGCKLCDQRYVYSENKEQIIDNIKQYGLRESEEQTMCVSLSVSGCNNLEDSLKKFVEGEKISDYTWNDEDKNKVTIVKKQCLSEVSNTVVFHLQRFTINFDTFLREKLNDHYSFPRKLNLKPYMKESQETNIPSSPSSASSPNTSSTQFRDEEYYEYELVGVVVHTGTSDSGHYFAYIKDQLHHSHPASALPTRKRKLNTTDLASNKKEGTVEDITTDSLFADDEDEGKRSSSGDDDGHWYEFNDAEIRTFDPNTQLETECFGGKTSIHEYIPSTQQFILNESTNSKNAYMVIYNRIKPTTTTTSTTGSASPSNPSNNVIASKMLQNIHQQIMKENYLTILFSKLVSKDHFQFYLSLLKLYFQLPSTTNNTSITTTTKKNYDIISKEYFQSIDHAKRLYSIFYDAIQFWNVTMIHSIYIEESKFMMSLLIEQLKQIDDFILHYHQNLPNNTSNDAFSITSPRNSIIVTEPASSEAMQVADKENTLGTKNANISPKNADSSVLKEIDVRTLHTVNEDEEESGDKTNKENIDQNTTEVRDPSVDDPSVMTPEEALASVASIHNHLTTTNTIPLPPQPPTVEEERRSKGETTIIPKVPQHYVSKILLRYACEQIDNFINHLIYPPKEEIRKEIANFYIQLFLQCLQCEKPDMIQYTSSILPNSLFQTIEFGTIVTSVSWAANNPSVATTSSTSTAVAATVVTTAAAMDGWKTVHGTTETSTAMDVDEDDDLALAIKLSQESLNAEDPKKEIQSAVPIEETEKEKSTTSSAETVVAATTVPIPVDAATTTGDDDQMLIDDDPDLALAIQLSKESISTTTTTAAVVTSVAKGNDTKSNNNNNGLTTEIILSQFQSIHHESIKFLCLISIDKYLQLIPDNWRKCESYQYFLLQLCKQTPLREVKHILILRNLIANIIDIIMGEQSPLNGKLYVSNNNSSTAHKTLSSNSKNIPDWTYFLQTIILLLNECDVRSLLYIGNNTFEWQQRHTLVNKVPLSEWDYLCITNKTFYSILIKQVRYVNELSEIIRLLSIDNLTFTNMIIEVLLEEMSIIGIDNIHILFTIIEKLLSIKDSFSKNREYSLFGRNNTSSLLELMNTFHRNILYPTSSNGTGANSTTAGSSSSSAAAYGNKTFVLIVFIRSFLALIMQNASLYDTMTFSRDTIHSWSIWMFQYILYQSKKYALSANPFTSSDAGTSTSSTNANSSNSTSTSPSTGAFLMVYGEEFPQESDLPWVVRIEKTLQLFTTLLQSWEVYDENKYSLSNQLINNLTNSVTSGNQTTGIATGTDNDVMPKSSQVVQLQDGMTDEELARLLESEQFDVALD